MKVLWLANIPSPYRVKFFNELGKLCELTVLFEQGASSERDESWKQFEAQTFEAIFLKGKQIGVAESFCPQVVKYLKKDVYDYIFVTNFSDPTGWLAILTLRLKRMRYIIESDGGFAGTGKGIKERFKKFLISGATLFFSTADKHDEYYRVYGADKQEIVRYPFTSLSEKDILEKPCSMQEKKLLREKLGIGEEKVILAVGQFIPRKGFDILIRAIAGMEEKVGCYIVGGTPPQDYTNLVHQLKVKNIHFVDFKRKDELNEYYLAADLFVHPTREDIWGLVINEAMAKGLPVITTDKCIAGLQLVKDGRNGYVIPAEDEQALRMSIQKVLTSSLDEMSGYALDIIRDYTVENMALIHIETLRN